MMIKDIWYSYYPACHSHQRRGKTFSVKAKESSSYARTPNSKRIEEAV